MKRQSVKDRGVSQREEKEGQRSREVVRRERSGRTKPVGVEEGSESRILKVSQGEREIRKVRES